MSVNKHLNFDLDSLSENSKEFKEEREKLEKVMKASKKAETSSGTSNKTRNIVVFLIIVVVIFIFGGSDESSTSTDYPASSDSEVQVGNYFCSNSDANTASDMEPSSDEKDYLEEEGARLDEQSDQLEILKNEIEFSSVSEYSSQYQIDQYNDDVQSYEDQRESYNNDVDYYTSRLESYNEAVASYNAYLESNCR